LRERVVSVTYVLVVDDEPRILRTLLRDLARLGIRGKGATDYDSALRLAAEENFDAAVLDLRLIERTECNGLTPRFT
jgi:DNA-binding response OmpR family regulator